LDADDEFCGRCGFKVTSAAEPSSANASVAADHEAERTAPHPAVAPSPPTPPPTSGGGGAGWWSNARHVALASAAGLAVVGGVVVVALVLTGRGSTPRHQSNAAASQPTATTVDPAVAKAEQEYAGYVTRIENIVQQSTSGRGEVGTLVTGVENGCRIFPYDASQQIRTVIDNRTSILNQLAGLSAAANPEAQNFYSLLQQALQSSINADVQYKGWMDFLYTSYYNTYPVGCPGGNPRKNAAFDAARTADGQSTRLKEQFVAAFNPVANRFAQPTWQASDF
jgi:hypothetical protein